MLIGSDKKLEFEKTNWAKRPITDKILDFLAHEVHFLLQCAQFMLQKDCQEEHIKAIGDKVEMV